MMVLAFKANNSSNDASKSDKELSTQEKQSNFTASERWDKKFLCTNQVLLLMKKVSMFPKIVI